MTETLQLLRESWPHLALLFLLVIFYMLRNANVSLTWSARTLEPEPNRADRLKAELDEAREVAAGLRAEIERRQ